MARVRYFVRKPLDKNFINAIKNRNLSIEQLDHYYAQLINEKKSAPTDFIIACVAITIGFYFLTWELLDGVSDYLKAFPFISPAFLVLFYDYFYLRINQFKSAVKKGYPELKDRYK
jgi:hypothetical protein